MKLSSVGLTLLLGMGFAWTPSHGLSYKNIALIAGAVVAGGVVGKLAYDYWFTLNDAQEFELAIELCSQSQELLEKLKSSYHTDSFDSPCTYAWLCNHLLTQRHIAYPFYNFVYTISADIKKLEYQQDAVTAKKIHIFERRIKLVTLEYATNPEQSTTQGALESYDFALEELQNILHEIQALRAALEKIYRHVVVHPQYVIEKQQIYIEQLEKQLYYQHKTHYYPAPVWTQPVNHIHVHNTHVMTPPAVNNHHHVHMQKPQEKPSCNTQTVTIAIGNGGPETHLTCVDDTLQENLYTAGNVFN